LAASDDGSVQAPQWLARVLAAVSTAEGLLACGMVDLDSGDLLATEGDAGLRQGLRQQAAALCAARRAHLAAGGPEIAAPEEILVSMGMRQALLRRLTQSDSLGFVALVDRARANLSLLRFRLNEAERQLD
jgi:arginine utilization protein RocB